MKMKELREEWINYLIMDLDEEIDMINLDDYIFIEEEDEFY